MNYPQSEGRRNQTATRNRLEFIEQMLDTVNLRTLTPDLITRLYTDLDNIILEINNIPNEVEREYFRSKGAVLENLNGARVALLFASQLLEEKRKPESFYLYLRECQTYLEKALANW